MDRRGFIRSSCMICAGGTIVSLLQACSSGKYLTGYTVKENKVAVKKADFTVVKKDKTVEQKFVLLKPEGLSFPIALYKVKSNSGTEEYKALYLQCTHQGCEVTPYESTVVCPCHGAEFNTKGMVTQGPAESDLKTFVTTHDNETIYIQL